MTAASSPDLASARQEGYLYTSEEEAFRARMRGWLEEHTPKVSAVRDMDALRAWQRKLHSAGLLGAAWPKEYGGAGLSEMEQAILSEELARVRAPGVINAMAIWWVGPAIMKYGTEAQKQRFIPKILTAEEIWATGYSEPSSGSDMAAAKTRAVRDGDHYVVSGQKIWTTYAARAGEVGPRWQRGIPSVRVRALRQLRRLVATTGRDPHTAGLSRLPAARALTWGAG